MANDQLPEKIKFDLSGLEELLAALKGNYVTRVGIIGAKAKAKHNGKDNLTNAQLGTFHEQPDRPGKKLPRRSFLEDSIKHELKFNSEKMKPMRAKLFKEVFQKKAPKKFMADLGSKCLIAIEAGFATNGFGRWKAWSKAYEERRKKMVKKIPRQLKGLGIRLKEARELIGLYANILTLTGKLRHSITFKIKKLQ